MMLIAKPSRGPHCLQMELLQDALAGLFDASALAPTRLSDAGRRLCDFPIAPKWGLGSAFIIKLEIAEFATK